METRRWWLRRLVSAVLGFLFAYVVDKKLEEVLPDLPPMTGTLNVTLEPVTLVATGVVGAEGHAAGRATVRGVSA